MIGSDCNRYFGVLAALQTLGIIKQGITPIGGVSGGGIAAAASCLGLSMPDQLARNHENAAVHMPYVLVPWTSKSEKACKSSQLDSLTQRCKKG